MVLGIEINPIAYDGYRANECGPTAMGLAAVQDPRDPREVLPAFGHMAFLDNRPCRRFFRGRGIAD